MPAIRIKNGPDKGKVFEVGDEPLTIGRDPTEGIPILDQGASRSHAEIFRVGEMCFIRDLGSKNGTFVNDEKISEELLQVGDKIRVGNTLFVFEEAGVAGEEPAPRRIEFDPEPPVGATIEIDLRKGERRASSIEGVTDTRSLRVLYDLARLLTSETREEDVLRKVLEMAVEAVGADAGYVFVVGEGGKLVPSATVEKNREEGRKISRSIIRRVLRSQKPVLTTDASSDAQWKERQSVILKKIQSVICVPLVSFEKVGGVLYLHGSRMGQIFADEDFDLVTAMGIQAGVAIATLKAAERERRVVLSAVRTLVAIGELRDPKTRGHSERVCTYAAAIANQLALGPRESQTVQLAALLHDVGKVVKGERTAVRMAGEPDAFVEEHVRNGEMILRHMEGMEDVIPGITYHHARCDGSGHPPGVRGPDIPQIGKIVGLANDFDNLCTVGDEAGKPYSVKEA
ncbi:MAG: GAF domain-containing protein, partial [Planctomycetales bacterium]|nr:GAF domain-containing protein [Planctomycetales bacterium]